LLYEFFESATQACAEKGGAAVQLTLGVGICQIRIIQLTAGVGVKAVIRFVLFDLTDDTGVADSVRQLVQLERIMRGRLKGNV